MNNSKILRRLLLLSTFLVLASAVAAGVYTRGSKSQKKTNPRAYEAAKVTSAPQVVSSIDGLEISGVSLINEGTPEASVAIDVTNNRDQDLMALDFIAGKNTYSGLLMDGLLEEDDPRVIIPRHSLKTFNWGLGAIMEGETIFIAAAVFSDGKEEGDKGFLQRMKIGRLKSQQKMRELKGKNGGPK